jgi:hypothetical protein
MLCYRPWTLSAALLTLGLWLSVDNASAASKVLDKTTTGNPKLQSIDAIRFAPEGVLLVADGKGGQIVAIQTGDTSTQAPLPAKISDIQAKLAGRLGAKADGIEILDLAVNPASGMAYFAVRKQDGPSYLIMTLRGSSASEGSEIGELSLDKATYARLPLPASENAPISKITDLAWADDRIIAAASTSEDFGSKIFSMSGPVSHEAQGKIYSAETYHVSHHKWETKAPMSVIMPYKEDGKTYVVGAFACTPVVKYPIDSIDSGEKVKGTSVLELGNGQRPLDMFVYQKDGKEYVLSNTLRRRNVPAGASPFATVRIDRSVLGENDKVNEQALLRLNKEGKPADDRVTMIDSYSGVSRMDKLDDSRALVLRASNSTPVTYDLEALSLP